MLVCCASCGCVLTQTLSGDHAMQVPQLKNLCKQEQVKGYSKLKRRELVNLLQKELQSR